MKPSVERAFARINIRRGRRPGVYARRLRARSPIRPSPSKVVDRTLHSQRRPPPSGRPRPESQIDWLWVDARPQHHWWSVATWAPPDSALTGHVHRSLYGPVPSVQPDSVKSMKASRRRSRRSPSVARVPSFSAVAVMQFLEAFLQNSSDWSDRSALTLLVPAVKRGAICYGVRSDCVLVAFNEARLLRAFS